MDNSKIISACIDDFAPKKRQRYGTVMVNVETHKIVDMIESRETDFEKPERARNIGVSEAVSREDSDSGYTRDAEYSL